MAKMSLSYQNYEVISTEKLIPDVTLLKIRGKLKFEAGQFIQVKINHYGEATYAPCNNFDQKDSFEICVKGQGDLSNHLVNFLPGDKLQIRGPYGKGWPIGRLIEKDILIITGGMGIIPFRPLIYQVINNRADFKTVTILSGFKSKDHIIFKDDYYIWQKKFKNLKVYLEYGYDYDFFNQGIITEGVQKLNIKNSPITLICGPEIMYKPCYLLLENKKVPKTNTYLSFERRMECGVGFCQHCNIGKYLVCKDGPVFRLDKIINEIGK